jgi:hypothetical protein
MIITKNPMLHHPLQVKSYSAPSNNSFRGFRILGGGENKAGLHYQLLIDALNKKESSLHRCTAICSITHNDTFRDTRDTVGLSKSSSVE